ncbi:MAG TPA: SEC-C metal-binding domain-containing protein, partial [Lentisphaeria bacterium]|nr:SEC-C metal-binding domain-containing protein [Lentisphaeria bacterium]
VSLNEFKQWLARIFPISFPNTLFSQADNPEALAKTVQERVEQAYELKVQQEHPDALQWLERYIMLNPIDNLYQDHLYAMDALRQGVQLRSYGQRDPLVEYKQEAYELFSVLMDSVKAEICSNIFRFSTVVNFPDPEAPPKKDIQTIHEAAGQFDHIPGLDDKPAQPQAGVTIRRQMPKVGRNDPCPCGSGKKYKSCCGR